MSPIPWSETEFERLLTRQDCPSRTPGANAVVMSFIHNYHKGQNLSGLSRLMQRRLERGSYTCPKCGTRVGPR